MESIIYKVDRNGNRLGENVTAFFCDDDEESRWIKITGSNIPYSLQRGDFIHYSGGDVGNLDGDYEILEVACEGMYRVKMFKREE